MRPQKICSKNPSFKNKPLFKLQTSLFELKKPPDALIEAIFIRLCKAFLTAPPLNYFGLQ